MLLDTQAALWLDSGDASLGPQSRREIERAWQSEGVAVSAITFWETAMLKDKGRITFPDDVHLWRREQLAQGWIEIPVNGEIAARAGQLPGIHGDPADRLIIATALEGHQLVTSDRRILAWPGTLSRLNARQ
jgi:PIN domain nuclease of toxin-antitoxin system